jgi:hypothetical protein
LGARYYDSIIRRFISADTIVSDPANPQSLNRYSYCLNNPLRYTDPTGHDQIITTGGVNSNGQTWYTISDGAGNLLAIATGIDDLAAKMSSCESSSRGVDLPVAKQTVQEGPPPINSFSDFLKGFLYIFNLPQNAVNQRIAEDNAKFSDNAFYQFMENGGWVGFSYGMGIPNPEGLGSTIKAGYSHAARNAAEMSAIERASVNPASGLTLQNVTMKDPKWPASEGWVKKALNVNKIEVHYVYNTRTGAFDDLKIIGK